MKKGKQYLSISLLAFSLISFSHRVYSQNQNLTRKELSEKRKTENILNFERLGTLIESKKFMCILDDTKFKDDAWVRRCMPRPPYLMMIDSSYAFLYLNPPSDNYRISEGSIGGWNLKKDLKKLCFYLTFKIIGPSTLWDLDFYIIIKADDSAYARVKSGGSENFYNVFPHYMRIARIDSSFISK